MTSEAAASAPRTWLADALLFDFDGVLVDSRARVGRMWADWARSHGIDPAALVGRVHGRRTVDVVAEFARGLDAVAEADRIERAETESDDPVTVLPGAARLLGQLSREAPDRWAIVTSGTEALARARLAATGLWSSPVLVAAGDVARGKPAPDGYLLAASRLGVDPARAVVFEDAPDGVAAARAAGATVVGVVGDRDPGALGEVAGVVRDLAAVGLQVAGGGLVVTVG